MEPTECISFCIFSLNLFQAMKVVEFVFIYLTKKFCLKLNEFLDLFKYDLQAIVCSNKIINLQKNLFQQTSSCSLQSNEFNKILATFFL